MAANPFDYLTAINDTKENLVSDELGEKGYNPFMTNRGLSYFKDSVYQANEMNRAHHLDKALQFLFLLNTVSRRKRFSKWFKAEKMGDLELVKEYYGYSNVRAAEALAILTPEQIEYIKTMLYKGGRT